MLRLVGRRLAIAIPVLLVVSMLTFALLHLGGGNAVFAILGPEVTPHQEALVRGRLGLDAPLVDQYWNWLTGVLHGDFGTSFQYGQSVGSLIVQRLGVTLALVAGATLVSAVVGVAFGVLSAIHKNRLGPLVSALSLIGYAIPSFWLALLLVSQFAVGLGLFPATGIPSLWGSPGEWLRSLALPVAALAFSGIAVITKQTRDAMLDVLGRGFVRNLRANGIPERSIVLKHGLRNASVQVLTVVGLVFVGLLGGTVVIESVFALPGLGTLAVEAAGTHDLPLVQGVTICFAVIVVVVNLLVDVLYGWLNPRVRVS